MAAISQSLIVCYARESPGSRSLDRLVLTLRAEAARTAPVKALAAMLCMASWKWPEMMEDERKRLPIRPDLWIYGSELPAPQHWQRRQQARRRRNGQPLLASVLAPVLCVREFNGHSISLDCHSRRDCFQGGVSMCMAPPMPKQYRPMERMLLPWCLCLMKDIACPFVDCSL